jgi:hypothetical protein
MTGIKGTNDGNKGCNNERRPPECGCDGSPESGMSSAFVSAAYEHMYPSERAWITGACRGQRPPAAAATRTPRGVRM